MKNHFFMSYAGNKRNETEGLYNVIKNDIQNIKIIIEPFCGSAAFSYYISLKHPKKFKYILNDNNKFLIQLYLIAKDELKLNQLIKILDVKIKGLDKEKYNKIAKENNFLSWIIINKIYSIHKGLFPIGKKIINTFEYLKECPIINFLRTEQISFFNTDGIVIMNKYKNSESNFIFLDPPYLISCNDFYKNTDVNIYEYLYNKNINEMKAFICLCLESNWIIKLLFNNHVKKEYSKIYQTSKKNTTHLIITNKN